ncbi:MAG: hypothetical protein SFU56_13710 [Capsulimonadales bacterium]|nr:hypothetical protein [Capsulimonadales bacterium]
MKVTKSVRVAAALVGLLAAVVLGATGGAVRAQEVARPLLPKERFPYGSEVFTAMIDDSYRLAPDGRTLPEFYGFYRDRVRQAAERTRIPALATVSLEEYLNREGQRIAGIRSPEERLRAELELSDGVFRIVKKSITRFSLDRGFEFAGVVRTGERQCLLQSVLVAGMLQKAGLPAGVVMVWKGETGEASNLGHCVALMRHCDGTDRILDVSTHNVPDLMHRGLYLCNPQNSGYLFVEPVFDAGTRRIREYLPVKGGRTIPAHQVRPLTVSFLRSQFDFYRGERAPGRLIWKQATPEALERSAQALERAVRTCPQNPLATYYLGRVRARQGQEQAARQRFAAAFRLYEMQGWVPDSATEVYALAKLKAVAARP